jgi:drug/metabolite transporter (DMT)-like permease
MSRPMSATEWAMLVTLSMLWGGSFFFIGIAVLEVPPLTIVLARVAIAAIVLNLYLAAIGQTLPASGAAWRAFAIMGLLNNVIPFSLIVWGQSHIPSGLASILNATTPLFTIVVAHFMTQDEKATGTRLIGVVVGFIGVAVMVGGAALSAFGVAVLAQIAVLLATVSYAFSAVFGRRFRTLSLTPVQTAAGMVSASSLILLPVVLVVDHPFSLPIPSTGALLAILALAVMSTALAYILFFRILSTAGATNLLLVTFLIPVSAIGLGVMLLGESLLPKHFAGMALIGIGFAILDGRPGAWLTKRLSKA